MTATMPPCTKCGGLVLSTQSQEQDEWYCLCCGKRTWTAWPDEAQERAVCRAMKRAYQGTRGDGDGLIEAKRCLDCQAETGGSTVYCVACKGQR